MALPEIVQGAAGSLVGVTAGSESVTARKMYHIACKSWCTSAGEVMPLSFKVRDDDGEIVLVNGIRINRCEEKNHVGVLSREFDCEAVISGFTREFRLVYYCERCMWVMLV